MEEAMPLKLTSNTPFARSASSRVSEALPVPPPHSICSFWVTAKTLQHSGCWLCYGVPSDYGSQWFFVAPPAEPSALGTSAPGMSYLSLQHLSEDCRTSSSWDEHAAGCCSHVTPLQSRASPSGLCSCWAWTLKRVLDGHVCSLVIYLGDWIQGLVCAERVLCLWVTCMVP